MHNPFLKLASVLGIAGICILVILQIQRGLMNADQSVAEESSPPTAESDESQSLPANGPEVADELPAFAADETGGGSFPEPAPAPAQVEPAPFPDDFSESDSDERIRLANSESPQPIPDEPAFPDPAAFPDPERTETLEPTDSGPGIDFRDGATVASDDEPPMLRGPEEPSEDFNPEPEPAEWPDFGGDVSPEVAATETDDPPADALPEFGFDPEPEVGLPGETPAEDGSPETVEKEVPNSQGDPSDERAMPGPNLFAPEADTAAADEPAPERNIPDPVERELPPFGIPAEPEQPSDEPQPADVDTEAGFDQPAPFPDAPQLVESDDEPMPADEPPEFPQPGGPPRQLDPLPSEGAAEETIDPAPLQPEPEPFEPEPSATTENQADPPFDASTGADNIAAPDQAKPIPTPAVKNELQPQLQPVPDTVAEETTGQSQGAPLSPHDAGSFTTPAGHSDRPVVTLERPAPQNATAGQTMIYHLLVKNRGTLAAHDVVVKDGVPEGVQLTGTIPQAVLSGDRLFWRLGTLQPGEQRKISLRVVPQTARVVESTAEVRFANDYPVATAKAEPELHVRIDVARQAKLGDDVRFRFVVENRGQADATGVTIQHVMPAGFQHRHGRDLEYALDTVPAGETREAQLVLRTTQAGRLQTHTTVTADGNIAVERTTSVSVAGEPLVVQRISTAGHALGRPSVLQNRVTNQSGQTIVGATVVEILPAGFEFVAASDGGQFNPNTRTIAWPVGQLAAGESKDLKVKLVPKAGGVQTSVIRVIDGSGRQTETTVRTDVGG